MLSALQHTAKYKHKTPLIGSLNPSPDKHAIQLLFFLLLWRYEQWGNQKQKE